MCLSNALRPSRIKRTPRPFLPTFLPSYSQQRIVKPPEERDTDKRHLPRVSCEAAVGTGPMLRLRLGGVRPIGLREIQCVRARKIREVTLRSRLLRFGLIQLNVSVGILGELTLSARGL